MFRLQKLVPTLQCKPACQMTRSVRSCRQQDDVGITHSCRVTAKLNSLGATDTTFMLLAHASTKKFVAKLHDWLRRILFSGNADR